MTEHKRTIQTEVWVYRKKGGVVKLEDKHLSKDTLKAIEQDVEKHLKVKRKQGEKSEI